MPWFFTIPEFLKKRACRYLLQHYLGQFLEEKICLDDLTVDLYNGTGSIHNVPLNVEAINEVLLETGAPVKVLSGYLGCVTVSVPWTALLTDNCKVEISGLALCVAPVLHHATGDDAGSMTDSLFSMTTSMQLAEEVLKSGPTPGEGDSGPTGFEGMEALARAIELVLTRVQISLTDATVQINYRTPDQTQEYFLKARINSIDFFDELSKTETSVDSGDNVPAAQPLPDFSVKMLQLSGLTLEVGSTHVESVQLDQSVDDMLESSLLNPRFQGVPIATAGGQLSVKVKLKQNEAESGPKLEVEGFMGSLHLLLSPQQLGMLVEMATGIASQGSTSINTFEKLSPGQSRPIPKAEMKTIESQLAKHQLKEQKAKAKLQQQQDLFHADPWNNSIGNTPRNMTESTHSTMDEFYSLDLNTSYAESTAGASMIHSVSLEDSFISTDSRASTNLLHHNIHTRHGSKDTSNIPLHSGVGLQQLSSLSAGASHSDRGQSPFMKRPRAESGASEKSPQSSPRTDQHEMCKYHFTFGGITLALLEAQPVYMYTTPRVTSSLWATRQSSQDSGSSETNHYSSVDEGGLDPLKYFEAVCELLIDGVNKRELQSKEEELAQVLPNDHLFLWLSTVKCSVASGGPQLDLDLSVACAEMWEYLYRNQAKLNTITKPVSVSPIVQLSEDSSLTPPLPCIKLRLTSNTSAHGSNKKSSHSHSSEQVTSMDLHLATVHVNADVTLMDRVQPLLSALSHSTATPLKTNSLEKMKQSLYMTTSNYHTINLQRQAIFNAVSAESPTTGNHTVNIKVKAATLNLSLRFPIPDLKDTNKPPWYLRSLRSEVLFINMSNVGGSSHLKPSALAGEGPACADIRFDSTKVYLSCDGTVESRELFLTISAPPHQTSPNLTECGHIRLVIQPTSDSALERGGRKGGIDVLGRHHSFELGSEVKEPSPFSSRKTMVSTGKAADEDTDGGRLHTEEQVLPGSPGEMREFEQMTIDCAHYAVTLTFPVLKVHLPSNRFLGLLYNRFATDLALWEPASPAAVDKANVQKSMMMTVLQPAATNEDRFEMCKSVLKEEDSDDESTLAGVYSVPTLSIQGQAPPNKGVNLLAISLSVEEATVSMLTQGDKTDSMTDPSSEHSVDSTMFHSAQSVAQLLDLSPRQKESPDHPFTDNGLVLGQVSGIHLFTVLGYKEEPGHDYFCAQISDFSLHHIGTLNMETYSCVEDSAGSSVLATLQPVVYRSGPTPSNKPHTHSGYEQPDPMLAIAMEMRFHKERNSKTNKCAVGVHNTTIQYYVTPPQHNCFKQLGDFFSVTDDDVPGYEAPSVITELHTHLNNCYVEYKPLHLPLHMLLCVDSVSLSTSLVTGAPVLVLRLVTDGTYLLLAHQQYQQPDPKQGFVCVLEMEWFELTVRLCDNDQLGEDYDKLFSRLPDVSVECSSNVVHLRTCVDSCIALRDLLVYLSTNGDLQTPITSEAGGVMRDYSSLGHEHTSLSSQTSGPSAGTGSPLTSLTDQADIGDLISDAMEDLPPPHSSHTRTDHGAKKRSGKHKKGVPKTASKMEVLESDKSVVVDFLSDSSDEDDISVGSTKGVRSGGSEGVRGGSRERLLSPPTTSKMSGSGQSSIFSESDDDFCFVDTPTSTKVSPGSKPQVKCLLEDREVIEIMENHFSVPDRHTDQLQRPKHFPEPISQFTLKEISIIWHMYGGTDFSPPSPSTSPALSRYTPPTHRREYPAPSRSRSGSGNSGDLYRKQSASPAFQRKYGSSPSGKYGSSPGSDFVKVPSTGAASRGLDWKSAGGPGRQHDVLVEIELDKLRIQHEKFPSDTEQSSRLVVLINELEVRDRLRQSNINKLLYQYTTEHMPRQSHANMLSLKVLFTRPELTSDPSIEEASVRVSVLPIRLNIDQDTLLFLLEFMRQVGSTSAVTVAPPPDLSDAGVVAAPALSSERRGSGTGLSETETPPPNRKQDVFIRSFIWQPDLPIRIDYEAKGFKTEMGTLAGFLLGLSHLNTSEVRLKSLVYKKGLLGWDKLVEYASNEWVQDIKAYQLPLILKGVGPMHHVTQLVHGMVDLVWLPYQQYQEDGRIMWGLQRGATAFTSSTGVAIVELSSRLLESVQSFAQMAYDMVAPTECPSQALVHQHKPHEPLDFREGFANAYDVVSAGIGGTARDMYSAATREHEERGMTGAVGGVLRQIPGTIVKPIILASEATRHVLGGVKNQFVPDARKEANEKWKTSDTEQH